MPDGNLLGAALLLVVAAALFFWIFRDARARDAYPVLWVAAIFAATFLIHPGFLPAGLLVYLLARPKGRLDRCPHCGAPHLHWLARCPKCSGPLKKDCHHCGADVPYSAVECTQCGRHLG